jgi:hypothetical protein
MCGREEHAQSPPESKDGQRAADSPAYSRQQEILAAELQLIGLDMCFVQYRPWLEPTSDRKGIGRANVVVVADGEAGQ